MNKHEKLISYVNWVRYLIKSVIAQPLRFICENACTSQNPYVKSNWANVNILKS